MFIFFSPFLPPEIASCLYSDVFTHLKAGSLHKAASALWLEANWKTAPSVSVIILASTHTITAAWMETPAQGKRHALRGHRLPSPTGQRKGGPYPPTSLWGEKASFIRSNGGDARFLPLFLDTYPLFWTSSPQVQDPEAQVLQQHQKLVYTINPAVASRRHPMGARAQKRQ